MVKLKQAFACRNNLAFAKILCTCFFLIISKFAAADVFLDDPKLLNESKIRTNEFRNKKLEDRCSTISQQKKMGPVQDQFKLGWCFSYAATDMLSHKLKIGPPDRVSPVANAVSFYSKHGSDIDWQKGQNTHHALELATGFRLIDITPQSPTNRIQSQDAYNQDSVRETLKDNKTGQYTFLTNLSGGYIKNALLAAQEDRRICLNSDLNIGPNANQDFTAALAYAHLATKKTRPTTAKCKNQNVPIVSTVTEIVNASVLAIYNHIAAKCTYENKEIQNFNPVVYTAKVNNRIEILQKMNETLDSGDIFGISYSPAFMISYPIPEHSYHASTIIGRTMSDGKCFYQLRNSWGESCEYYKKTDLINCENGGSIWIEENELLKNTASMTVLEKLENRSLKKMLKTDENSY